MAPTRNGVLRPAQLSGPVLAFLPTSATAAGDKAARTGVLAAELPTDPR
ncbi:hypothetical protein [Streptomyces sp. H39-S7]|nr:hypothetical protein [Streptomyces sp. H39-S7]MCZ4125468.1 hypothetical protein [Streptomyces sp. H39-S7]